MPCPTNTYTSFAELARNQIEGQDYIVLARQGRSGIAVIAPHAGGIEAGTGDLADAVAGDSHSFYTFKGIKPDGNRVLHITSHRFDEPVGLQVVCRADVALSIHGHHDRLSDIVYIGGRNDILKEKIVASLTRAGFRVEIPDRVGLQAKHPQNLCNRCSSGQGVQLEITRALREKMFDRLFPDFGRIRTRQFFRFISALRAALR